MKVTFKDGSFLEIIPSASGEEPKITIVMCGHKGYNQVTMSSSDLSPAQTGEMIEFLKGWLENLGTNFT